MTHEDPLTVRDQTLSERVARATTWERAVRVEDGAYLIELSVYRVDTVSALPRANFDMGPIGIIKRLVQGRPIRAERTVPRSPG